MLQLPLGQSTWGQNKDQGGLGPTILRYKDLDENLRINFLSCQVYNNFLSSHLALINTKNKIISMSMEIRRNEITFLPI